MAKINLNKLAIEVSYKEGLKKQVNIAQIKEIIRVTFEQLANYSDAEIVEAVRRGN